MAVKKYSKLLMMMCSSNINRCYCKSSISSKLISQKVVGRWKVSKNMANQTFTDK